MNRIIKLNITFVTLALLVAYLIGSFFSGFLIFEWNIFAKILIFAIWVVLTVVAVLSSFALDEWLSKEDAITIKERTIELRNLNDEIDFLGKKKYELESEISEIESRKEWYNNNAK